METFEQELAQAFMDQLQEEYLTEIIKNGLTDGWKKTIKEIVSMWVEEDEYRDDCNYEELYEGIKKLVSKEIDNKKLYMHVNTGSVDPKEDWYPHDVDKDPTMLEVVWNEEDQTWVEVE